MFDCSKRAWALRGHDCADATVTSPSGRSSAAAAVLLSVTEQPVVTLYDALLQLHGLSLSNQTKGLFVFVGACLCIDHIAYPPQGSPPALYQLLLTAVTFFPATTALPYRLRPPPHLPPRQMSKLHCQRGVRL